ncbi:hypothetical protein CONPUDRAFT_71030 [Coniophora puteana RWD-64-598 SS2]|uniref:Uncharacterized protein n=1 Tax=Coniophora puteana (strain RWD-64-598) TaxID=741705 RepID=A0A5M3MYS7_CONPW|nr:uncharacterized protein CONPUDRAFT_71030 [Coniophora puteana RWD-64-598 SS2]EIW84206.1 hypothetical protein CONPUDRAFT_71030 [Coniophora puteana RWD-64-598 SS2]
MPRAPNCYTLFNVLVCNAVTVSALPIYPTFETSVDLRPLITVVIAFLGFLAMFLMIKYIFLKSRRIETIHSPHNPSTPQFRNIDVDLSEKTQSLSGSKSSLRAPPARALPADLDDILVGCLGSPHWETTSHSTLDFYMRKQRQEDRHAYQQHKAKAQRRARQTKARMSIVGRIRASFVPAPVSAAVLRFSHACPSLDELEAQLDSGAFYDPMFGVNRASRLTPPKPGDLGYNDSWTTAGDTEELEKLGLASPLEDPRRRLKFTDHSSAKLSSSSSFVALPSMASVSVGLQRASLPVHIVFDHDSDSYSVREHVGSQEYLIRAQASQSFVAPLSNRGGQFRSEGLPSDSDMSLASPTELTDAILFAAGLSGLRSWTLECSGLTGTVGQSRTAATIRG